MLRSGMAAIGHCFVSIVARIRFEMEWILTCRPEMSLPLYSVDWTCQVDALWERPQSELEMIRSVY